MTIRVPGLIAVLVAMLRADREAMDAALADDALPLARRVRKTRKDGTGEAD